MEALTKKLLKVWALVLVICAFSATTALAATATLSFSTDETISAGSTVNVTVTIQSDAAIGEADMFINFDSAMLQYASGDGELQDDGSVRLREQFTDSPTEVSWTLQFTALAEGDTTIYASNVWVKNAETASDGSTTATVGDERSTTITIGAGDASATVENTASEETTSEDDALAQLAEEIANDGTMSALVGTEKWMVQENFSSDILPANFEESSQFYKGVEVKAAKLNNAEYYMVLVMSEDGTQSKFVYYDSTEKTFRDVIQLATDESHTLYLLKPDELTLEVPEAFTQTVLTVGESNYDAWQVASNVEYSYVTDQSEFYLLGGYDQDGTYGWFLYDTQENTFQRYTEMYSVTSTGSAVESETEDSSLRADYNALVDRFEFMIQIVKYVAVGVIALLLLIIIISATERGGKKKDKKKAKKEKKQQKEAEKQKREEEKLKQKEAEKQKREEEKKRIEEENRQREEEIKRKKEEKKKAKEKQVANQPKKQAVAEKAAATGSEGQSTASDDSSKTAEQERNVGAAAVVPDKNSKEGVSESEDDMLNIEIAPLEDVLAESENASAAGAAKPVQKKTGEKAAEPVKRIQESAAKPAQKKADEKAAEPVKQTRKGTVKPAKAEKSKKAQEDFIDDYETQDLPKTEAEEVAVGVLKPLKEARVSEREKKDLSMTASIEELSKQIQMTMSKEEKQVDTESVLEELTFLDLDE